MARRQRPDPAPLGSGGREGGAWARRIRVEGRFAIASPVASPLSVLAYKRERRVNLHVGTRYLAIDTSRVLSLSLAFLLQSRAEPIEISICILHSVQGNKNYNWNTYIEYC